MAEKIALRIKNVANAVLVSGQAYQDPKDALNEFVSNAADEYAEAGRTGERIRVVLRRSPKRGLIAISDDGRGMDAERLKSVAQSLFASTKAGDQRTLGEKAIGILAFQQLGRRCEIVSRSEGATRSSSLKLERGKRNASLEPNERRRHRDSPGTTVYILDLDPAVLRMLTQRKVVDYLRRRRGPALARGDYQITVQEKRVTESVTPEEPDGVRLQIPARSTLWGRIEFGLYVAPSADRRRRVAVVGRAGTTIIEDLAELDEFDRGPWSSNQVSGFIAFDALQQSSGRRAILRDREAFPLFVEAVNAAEPLVAHTLDRIARDVDAEQAERLADAVRRIFSRVLRELADLDNPMRTSMGTEPGEGGLLVAAEEVSKNGDAATPQPEAGSDELSELEEPPDPEPAGARSRFDAEAAVVFYNEGHPDYLLVKDDEPSLLDYLATLVAKEYVVYNNPRAEADELAEEMVRMLVRVRRHMTRRR